MASRHTTAKLALGIATLLVGPVLATATADDERPIIRCAVSAARVRVTATTTSDPEVYSLEVDNGHELPIISFVLGAGEAPEMYANAGSGTTATSAPNGWSSLRVFYEESIHAHLLWEIEIREAAIPSGGSLRGFGVRSPLITSQVPLYRLDGTRVERYAIEGAAFNVLFLGGSCAAGRVIASDAKASGGKK